MNWPNPQEATGPLKSLLRKICLAGRENVLQPGLGYKINRSPGGVSLAIYPSGGASATFRPFKVYPAANIADSSASWRTFQMRKGIVGFRSKYSIYNFNLLPNYQYPWTVTDGTDGNFSPDFDSQSSPENGAMTQVSVPSTGDLQLVGSPIQLVLDPTVDDNNAIQASIYLKIIDDSGDLDIETWVRMTTPIIADSTGRPQAFMPDITPEYIPIAQIVPYDGSSLLKGLSVFQVQYDHAISRHAAGQLTYRGNYTLDTLTNQIFYPGDVLAFGDPASGDVDAYVQTASGITGLVDPSGSSDWTLFAYKF